MILGIEGSPRKGGNSHKLLSAVLDGAKDQGRTVRAAHLRDHRYEPCVGCEACRKDKICTRFQDGMTVLYPDIVQARGLVLVSPVHNYNVTAWVKAFIDRLYCFYDFETPRPGPWSSRLAGQGKKALVMAVAEQKSTEEMAMTLAAMRLPLTALGYEVVRELAVPGVFDRGAVRDRPEMLEQARQAGKNLALAL